MNLLIVKIVFAAQAEKHIFWLQVTEILIKVEYKR